MNGLVSLGYLRMQAQQRADMENNPSISIPEWNQYLSSSYKELYDMLVAAYGNDYYMAIPYVFSLTGSQFYPLPDGSTNFLVNGEAAAAFYKLTGVDLQYSGSPSGWVSLRNFEFIRRNAYAYPNTTVNINGYTNLRYRLIGSQLELIPIPATSQQARIWYVPEPTSLQFAPTCAVTLGNPVVTASDTSGITVGMSVYAQVGIPEGTTVTAIDPTTNAITLSNPPTTNIPIATLIFWTDATEVDGISGWEEYIIVDAAIKAGIKQEEPRVEELRVQKKEMKDRIEGMAEGRDSGQASHVSDAMSLNGYGDDDCGDFDGGGGYGWGGY